MNSSTIFPNIWRFVGLVLIQVVVLSQAALTADGYVNVLLYPLFILFLPILLPTPAAVLLGFLVGLTVDMFCKTWGVHASAGALSAYARAVILNRFAPRGGYTGKEPIPAPVYFGWSWFLSVTAIFLAVHIFWYFSMSYFTPVYLLPKIIPQTLIAWVLTMAITLILTRLFNPKY